VLIRRPGASPGKSRIREDAFRQALGSKLPARPVHVPLNLSGKPGDDPLAHFLSKRARPLRYFASAMTIMLRTLGIPAREVNGFLPVNITTWRRLLVRASDAHSWW